MSAEADGYKLFVGNLPTDCTSEELRAVFSTYGVVTHVHVMNPHPRTGQRCAFVFYATRSAGEDACEVLDNQYKIRSDASQPIVVRWSKEPTKEFRPKESFAPAGHWEKGSQEKGSWGKGWEDDGWGWEWIGQSSKGSKGSWQGDGWSKGWSFREDGKGKAAKGPPPSYGKGWNKGYDDYEDVGLDATGTKLYVANLPEDIQESALEYVFGTYGTVEKVHVMRGKVKNGCISGFVEFEKPDEATTAIMSLDNKYEIRAGYGPLQVRLANATRKY